MLEESLALFRELVDKEAIAWLLENLADMASVQGDYSRGLALFEESLAMFREQGNKRGIAFCDRQSAVWLFAAQGDQATLQARLKECLMLSRELGDKDGISVYFWISGWRALLQGDAIAAYALAKQSLAHWQEMGNPGRAFWALALLGRIEAHRHDFVAARAFYEESLARARELNSYWYCAHGLEGLASVVAAQGETILAASLWGAAESLRERCGVPLTPIERVDYEPAVAAARTHLGEQAFASAWAEGRTMTLEQVLAAPL
jgi:tetratricopeptide (TPR) repeat protein